MAQLTKVEIEGARKAGLVRQGIYLRQLRAASKLTQREIARILDVEVGMVQHWERGRNPVGLEHQAALADLLHVDLSTFVVRLSLFGNPLLSAAVWRTPGTPTASQCCPACS